ncbi:MAG: pirin family protein [Planctomycetota bacterium]
MIQVRRSDDRGHANHGWLDSYHTFSFADYMDPRFMGVGHLRVINEDRVEPAKGFPTHGHRDMEILSYVLSGVLEHKDSMGNGSQMRPGDVQLMSAGTGVTHSEFNASQSEGLHFLQMWIGPKERGTEPRYEQKSFSVEDRSGRLRLVVSPDGADGSLTIGQDARLYAGILRSGDVVEQPLGEDRVAWLQVARGSVQLGDETLSAGDGALIADQPVFQVGSPEEAEVVLWEIQKA